MYKTINLLQEVLVYGMVFSCRKWNFAAPISQLHAESTDGGVLLSGSLFLHLRPLRAVSCLPSFLLSEDTAMWEAGDDKGILRNMRRSSRLEVT